MSRQKRASQNENKKAETESVSAQPVVAKSGIDSDVEDLLDEIDELLESNAEEFVKSYVQKGGQ